MKRILVTGANKGIGRAIVERVLTEQDDAYVYLGSRDAGRGDAARAALVEAHPEWSERVEVLEIDVSNDDSVQVAASKLEGQKLYGIVNNAGIGFGTDDLDAVLQVNTHGIRRVCDALVPQLEAGGRVVNVTSAAGPMYVAKCKEERQQFLIDPEMSRDAWQGFIDECLSLENSEAFAAAGLGERDVYGISKATANAYTQILARENPELKVNAVTPGFIATDLTTPYAEARGQTPEQMGMKTPYEGAFAPTKLLFDELEGSGRYYGSDAVRSPLHKYRGPGDAPYEGD